MMSTIDVTEQQVPLRTCVGCRRTAPRAELLHFVLAGDPPTIVPDVKRRASGRGASTHPNYGCLKLAVTKGGFKRAFKGDFTISASEMAGWARAQYAKRVDGLLLAARVAGRLAAGTDAVRQAMTSGDLKILIVARDAAGRRDELMAAAERLGRRCVVFGDKEHLGGLLGRASLGVVAVLHEDIAAEVSDALQSLAELAEDA